MLGIIIGASVLAMIAIGDGAKEIVRRDARKSVLCVPHSSGCKIPKYGDVSAIEAECPTVVTPQIWNWGGVLIQAPGYPCRLEVDATYTTAMDWNVKEGRFITDEDVKNATKVCVLGDEVATALFGNKSPLGQEIKIARNSGYYNRWGRKEGRRYTERFTVVGTFVPRGTSLRFGVSFDNRLYPHIYHPKTLHWQ